MAAKKQPEYPETFGIDDFRDGYLKDIANYYRYNYRMKFDDSPAIANTLMLLSVFSNNQLKLKSGNEHTRLNLWLLQVGPSRSGKTKLGNEVAKAYKYVTEQELDSPDRISPSALVDLLKASPHRMVLLRVDEFRRFISTADLALSRLTFVEMHDGSKAGSAFSSNKKTSFDSTVKSVSDFQFNILSQTTPAWLFREIDKTTQGLLKGGFFGRFLVIMDEDTDPARPTRFDSPSEEQKMRKIVGKELSEGGYLDHCDQLFSAIQERPAKIKYFLFDLETRKHIEQREKDLVYSKTCLKYDLDDDLQEPLVAGLIPIIKKVAALIEMSHLDKPRKTKGKNKGGSPGWDTAAKALYEGYLISQASYDEAFHFCVCSAKKWFAYIQQAASPGRSKEDIAASLVEEAIASWPKKDYTSFKLEKISFKGIKWSDLFNQVKSKIRTAPAFRKAVASLEQKGEVEVMESKVKRSKTKYIVPK